MTVGYNVVQDYDKGRSTDGLNELYRKNILEAEDKLKSFRIVPEEFAKLSDDSKDKILECALFRGTAYERLYYDEVMVRRQIVCYEAYLKVIADPKIREAAPKLDWEFEFFSANTYLALVDEYLYWNKVPRDILERLKQAAEDALAYARKNPENFRQNVETLEGALHTIQGYLGEISISEMVEGYEKWLKNAEKENYD